MMEVGAIAPFCDRLTPVGAIAVIITFSVGHHHGSLATFAWTRNFEFANGLSTDRNG